MEWERASNDDIDEAMSHFSGLAWAALAVVTDLILEVDRRQQWLADGSPDLKQWVGLRLGIRHSSAGRLVDLARRLQDLPHLRKCFAEGEFSMDQLESLANMATAATEAGLIGEARGLSNAALDRAARRANPPSPADVESAWLGRSVFIQRSLDGHGGRLRAELPGEGLDIVEQAITEYADHIPANPDTGVFDPYSVRMADGLVELCATTGSGVGTPPQMTIHTDWEALITGSDGVTESGNGTILANETARRLGCDSVVEAAVHRGVAVVGVGRRTRTIPGWLRRQLYYRDGGCRFPGCGRTRWTHGHHIEHWAGGGPTDLDNLITLCGFHHRFLHERGWTIETDDDQGRFVFRRPSGEVYPPRRPELHPRLVQLVSI